MFKELIEQIEHDEINNDIINRITKIINEERSIPFLKREILIYEQ